MNPQLPSHSGTLKVRIKKAESDIERVQFMLAPVSSKNARDPRWNASVGWYALDGDHILHDDGKNGDQVAGDGIYTTNNLTADSGDGKVVPGHYLLRIVAHDDQTAAIVDVDGIDIQ